MNKKELIEAVQEQLKEYGYEFTKGEVDASMLAMADVVRKVVVEGGKVKVPNLVTFESKPTAPRKARNPKTGDEINVPASTKVACKVDNSFKQAVK